MDWSTITITLLFALVGFICLLAIPLGLPGTWILLGLAALVEAADIYLGSTTPVTFGWQLLAVCAGLGIVGEVIEAGAGMVGAKWGGATRRGVIGALVGGIIGAIVLTLLIPIPLVGTFLGALLGTFAGAWIGEATSRRQSRPNESLRAAFAAALGHLAGTFGKLVIGTVVWILLVRAAWSGA